MLRPHVAPREGTKTAVRSVAISQSLYEQCKRRHRLAAARIIEVVPIERGAPVVQHGDETAIFQMCNYLVFHDESETETSDRGTNDHLRVAEHQRTVDPHLHLAPALLQFPSV